MSTIIVWYQLGLIQRLNQQCSISCQVKGKTSSKNILKLYQINEFISAKFYWGVPEMRVTFYCFYDRNLIHRFHLALCIYTRMSEFMIWQRLPYGHNQSFKYYMIGKTKVKGYAAPALARLTWPPTTSRFNFNGCWCLLIRSKQVLNRFLLNFICN